MLDPSNVYGPITFEAQGSTFLVSRTYESASFGSGKGYFPLFKEDLPALVSALREKFGEDWLPEKKVKWREFL